MPKIEFGVRLANSGPMASVSHISTVAQEAERLGYDAVWVHDHITWTPEIHRAHISQGSRDALSADQNPDFYESVTTLSYLAALTQRIRLGTAVLVLPCRHPITLAKELANLDVLSNGRLILGVGSGSPSTIKSKQFEVYNIRDADRGPMTDEYIQVLKTIWMKTEASFDGKYLKFDQAHIFPKPVQNPHPPIWIGGATLRSARRAAELGDGWIPGALLPEELKERIRYLRDKAREKGRGGVDLPVGIEKFVNIADSDQEAVRNAYGTIAGAMGTYERVFPTADAYIARAILGSPTTVHKAVESYVEAGTTHFEMKFIYAKEEQLLRMLDRFQREIVPSFR